MDFIIGGCHQGKLEYVKTQYHLTETDIMSAAGLTTTNITTKPCLTDFHLYIRHLMQTNQNIKKTIADLLQKNEGKIEVNRCFHQRVHSWLYQRGRYKGTALERAWRPYP